MALSLAAVAPAMTTISNQLSRAIERRADAFALELTDEPDAMVAFERRITLQNVGDPDPPRWQQISSARIRPRWSGSARPSRSYE